MPLIPGEQQPARLEGEPLSPTSIIGRLLPPQQGWMPATANVRLLYLQVRLLPPVASLAPRVAFRPTPLYTSSLPGCRPRCATNDPVLPALDFDAFLPPPAWLFCP